MFQLANHAAHHAWALQASSHHVSFYSLVYDRARYIAPIHGHFLVVKVTDSLLALLDISSQAEDLLLRAYGAHIQVRRARRSAEIIRAIPEALRQIKYVGRKLGERELRHVVGISDIGKMLFVGLEFVPSARAPSHRDEAWVTTAHYVDLKEIRRCLRRNLLRPVAGGNAA